MEDLIPTNKNMASFMGVASNALGVLVVDIVVETKEIRSTFFIIDEKPSYSVILGRNWIHTCECVP